MKLSSKAVATLVAAAVTVLGVAGAKIAVFIQQVASALTPVA